MFLQIIVIPPCRSSYPSNQNSMHVPQNVKKKKTNDRYLQIHSLSPYVPEYLHRTRVIYIYKFLLDLQEKSVTHRNKICAYDSLNENYILVRCISKHMFWHSWNYSSFSGFVLAFILTSLPVFSLINLLIAYRKLAISRSLGFIGNSFWLFY